MDQYGLSLIPNAYTAPTRKPENKKPSHNDWAQCLNLLVGRE